MKRAFSAIAAFAILASVQAQVSYTPRPYLKGLRYLKSQQRDDGSWGNTATTCLSLLAFLNYGETPESPTFGQTVAKGFEWAKSAKPKSEWEKLCLLELTSARYYMLHDTNCLERLQVLERVIDVTGLSKEQAALLKITRMANTKPKDESNALALLVNGNTAETPLHFYLKALAKYNAGRESWVEYSRNRLQPLVGTQESNGIIRLNGAQTDTDSTVFALLTLSTYYGYWTYYLQLGYTPESVANRKKDDSTKAATAP